MMAAAGPNTIAPALLQMLNQAIPSGSSPSLSTERDRSDNWTDLETHALLDTLLQEKVQVAFSQAGNRNFHVYEQVATSMQHMGFERTAKQVKRRISNLKFDYKCVFLSDDGSHTPLTGNSAAKRGGATVRKFRDKINRLLDLETSVRGTGAVALFNGMMSHQSSYDDADIRRQLKVEIDDSNTSNDSHQASASPDNSVIQSPDSSSAAQRAKPSSGLEESPAESSARKRRKIQNPVRSEYNIDSPTPPPAQTNGTTPCNGSAPLSVEDFARQFLGLYERVEERRLELSKQMELLRLEAEKRWRQQELQAQEQWRAQEREMIQRFLSELIDELNNR